MNSKELTYILQNPKELKKSQVSSLEKLSKEFPYFQPIRALLLKGLKDQESFKYNQELKTTAAYTADRGVLFDFITSDIFIQKEDEQLEPKDKNEITVVDPFEIKVLPQMSMDDAVTMKMEEAEDVLDPELFSSRQEESVITQVITAEALAQSESLEQGTDTPEPEIEEIQDLPSKVVENLATETVSEIESEQEPEEITLAPNKPFDFDKKEAHSFSEWLKLTSLTPLDQTSEKDEEEDTSAEQLEVTNTEESNTSEDVKPKFNQKDKYELIDLFIANNPKIPRGSKSASTGNLAKKNPSVEEELMTETLARVYVAQQNYKKAIQAYKILILKNPEKSGFFADQIRAIQKLKENK